MEIGTKVIVTTCQGEFRGQITGFGKSFGGDKLFKVSGDKIITQVRKPKRDWGQKLDTSIHCPKCETAQDCAFRSL